MSGPGLGFTGTREHLSEQQLAWLWNALAGADYLSHGACKGGDAAAHQAAVDNGVPLIDVHPPTNLTHIDPAFPYPLMDGGTRVVIHRPADYHTRDRVIVDSVDRLLACPLKLEWQGGGTWYTVHYAEKRKVPVLICYPDGRVEPR